MGPVGEAVFACNSIHNSLTQLPYWGLAAIKGVSLVLYIEVSRYPYVAC